MKFFRLGKAFEYLTTSQMEKLVSNTRTKQIGDLKEIIWSSNLTFAADDDPRPLILFDNTVMIPDAKGIYKREQFIGWAHPDLIFEISEETGFNLYVDCTFKVVPIGFYQLMA